MDKDMTLSEARALLKSPIWGAVRDLCATTGELRIYPSGDLRRLEYIDDATRKQIALWLDAIRRLDQWRKVIDGDGVRRLKEDYPGIYPEIFRLAPYFAGRKDPLPMLLKLKFPKVYEICFC